MAEEQALQIYWDKRMRGDKGKEEDKGAWWNVSLSP
jgi:hypothetical protein